jgi:D-arginine dehydrogenase
MTHFDVAIIGAGIAGASLAAEIAPYRSVLILEMEDQPGYHTTGRSNAFWHATYGGPDIAPLSSASLAWLRSPPAEFGADGFLSARGAIMLSHRDTVDRLDAFMADFAGTDIDLERMGRTALENLIPGLLPEWDAAILERSCFDIDVAAVHAAYVAIAKRNGAALACRSGLIAAQLDGKVWSLHTQKAAYTADVVINAAGAWADEVAQMFGAKPLGIKPYRRTIAQVSVGADVPDDLPLIMDVSGRFYFRPERGQIWLSPNDETPSPACDSAPDELDIARAIDRLEKVVDWPVQRVTKSWAGLRSFAPDRLPAYGFDAHVPGFFWCAGQGGFGIQTAPAAARLCASLITGKDRDPSIMAIDANLYDPRRFDDLAI